MRTLPPSLLALALLLTATTGAARRPVSDRPRKTQKVASYRPAPAWQRGSVHLTAANNDTLCLHLDSVRFSGFDKPSSGTKETFLLTNRNRLTLVGLSVEITYLNPDGRQIHARILTIPCSIPPSRPESSTSAASTPREPTTTSIALPDAPAPPPSPSHSVPSPSSTDHNNPKSPF